MTKGNYTKGFTLVELLVVIAVIAILAGAMFLVINPAKITAKSRDATRIAELSSVNKALASALADGKIVLTNNVVNTSDTATGVTGNNGWVRFGLVDPYTQGIGDYMNALPRDPLKGAGSGSVSSYFYRFASNNVGWELNAWMESVDSAKVATDDGGNANTCDTVPSTTCVYEIGTDPGLDLI